jgi:hypothetical protein
MHQPVETTYRIEQVLEYARILAKTLRLGEVKLDPNYKTGDSETPAPCVVIGVYRVYKTDRWHADETVTLRGGFENCSQKSTKIW